MAVMAYAKKTKSQQQVRYLFSKVSPLTNAQKMKLENELHSGTVKIRKTHKKKL